MHNFNEVPIRTDTTDIAKLPETGVDRSNESDDWKNNIELPEDSDDWINEIKLSDDAGGWQDDINLPTLASILHENANTNNEGVNAQTYSCEKDVDAEVDESKAEEKELTEDEINEKQRAAIKEALERIRNGEMLTKEELGNLGEMMMDQYYISKGYTPLNKHRVTSLEDKKDGFKTGIDGVYEKTNPDGNKSYIIADAKYNTSQLSETNDGKQMSDNWIDKRLDAAVGKEKADEIRDASEDAPNSVAHEVYHIDPNIDENGNMHTDIQKVDAEGNKIGDKTIVEYFDEGGNRIEPSENN